MKIVFIGGGHLAYAMVAALDGGMEVAVIDRNAPRRELFEKNFAVATAGAVDAALVGAADMIVLAVRPAQMRDLCRELPPHDALLVSVAAGCRLDALGRWTGCARIARAMPNTPLAVGLGATACCANDAVSARDREMVSRLFSGGGVVRWLDDEALMDAAVAVGGSAPAYVYYLIEAMQESARKMGLPSETATEIILQVVRGAAEMVDKTGKPASQLRQEVAVKGGTTERAINVMRDANFMETLDAAMRAARDRSAELSKTLDEPETP